MNASIISLIAITIIIQLINCDEERNYVLNEFSKYGTQSLGDIKIWRENYKKLILDKLNTLPLAVKNTLISKADKENKKEWTSKLASQYLEYVTTGDRVNFETTDTHRRVQLVNLVIGELLTKNGTYIKQISNGIWLICEESTWETPGHLYIQRAGSGLPDPDEDVIDLRVGEMAATISIIRLLLGEELVKVNQMFTKRIDRELHKRIVIPYLNNSDFWWMGFSGKRVNNHNSWDNSNILRTALLAIDDTDARNSIVNKSVHSIDYYINQYSNDGGCDEGPVYWGWGPGRLIDYLELMHLASNGSMSWSSNELIKQMGSFIYKVHIDQNKFVNFADSHALMTPEASQVYKFGKYMNDSTMKQFAAYVSQMENYTAVNVASDFLGSLSIFISQLLTFSDIQLETANAPLPKLSYFPDLQVVVARTTQGSTNGLFLAAKAGNNHENHNHNDVGNFIIYTNGNPAIIDIGVGKYTNVTFSKDRYTIWSMQSQWHNTPTINGIQQMNGTHYSASNVTFASNGGNRFSFEANIAGAYPKETDVKSWWRKIEFDGNHTVVVKDNYELKKWVEPIKVHFITVSKINRTSAGSIELKYDTNSLVMDYNSSLFDAVIDRKVIDSDDFELRRVWGDYVTRVTLVEKYTEGHADSLIGAFTTYFKFIS